MSLLRGKDLEYYSRHGIRRYWIVVSPDEAFFEIKRTIELLRGRKPQTADFTTMYTCLIHDHIIKNTRIALSEALEYDQKRFSGDSRGYRQIYLNYKLLCTMFNTLSKIHIC